MNASTIEVSGAIVAADLKQQQHEREAKKPALAKQKAGNRHRGGDDMHKVDRSHGPSLAQQAASVTVVDRGAAKSWRRAYSLPSFPDPPGYTLCWVARHRNRFGDDRNLLMSIREGYQFVRPSELAEEDLPTETFTGRLAKYGEVIGDETTVLMKLPNAFKAQRDKFYNSRRDQATKQVTRRRPGLAEANSKMPLVEDINETEMTQPRMRARRPPTKDADE
jgi:hypothetical protein